MKALMNLTGAEKARLLHDLFPLEIPSLLEDIAKFCEDFKADKEKYRAQWNSGFMSFDYWQGLADETAVILKKHSPFMKKSSRVFAEQLYFTYTSLFVTDRIIRYAEHHSKDEKFKLVVQALFT